MSGLPRSQFGGRALMWAWFSRLWRERRGMLAIIVALSLLNACILTAVPWLWQYVIDALRGTADPAHIVELGLWIAGVGLVQAAVYALLQALRTVVNAKLQWDSRAYVTDGVVAAEPAFFRAWRAGDVVTRISDDAGEKTSWFLCSGIFRTLEAFLVVLVCMGAMFWLDPGLTVWVCLPLPLLIIGQAHTQSALGPRFKAVQESISDLNDAITSTFSGIRVVQGSGLEGLTTRGFEVLTRQQRRAEIRATVLQQFIFLLYGYGWQLAVVALLLAGGQRVLQGQITLGEYVTFEGFLMTMVWPMFDFGMFVSRIKQAQVAIERLQELVDSASAHTAGEASTGGEDTARLQDEASIAVLLEQVRVEADDGTVLLDGLHLRTAPGEMLAVVGEVGAGKTTLMQLLAGARSPTAGHVHVAGRTTAGAVAYVPQDPILLSATVRENIVLGRVVGEELLTRALSVSRLAQDLEQLSEGLETLVGERGVTLSGGQQQRVALARALVGEPMTLLLDDATAALDADTEAAFWHHLQHDLPALTAVVVTHRAATIERADHVVVLDAGAIAQRGTHATLIATDGPYRRIYGRYRAAERLTQGSV